MLKNYYNLEKVGTGTYNTLELARNFLAKNLGAFPINKCQHASRFLKLTHGLDEVAGEYLGFFKEPQFHAWNYDEKSGLYIDITMNQFDFRNYNPIEILPIENFLIKKTKRNTRRHLDYANKVLDKELEELVKEFNSRKLN